MHRIVRHKNNRHQITLTLNSGNFIYIDLELHHDGTEEEYSTHQIIIHNHKQIIITDDEDDIPLVCKNFYFNVLDDLLNSI